MCYARGMLTRREALRGLLVATLSLLWSPRARGVVLPPATEAALQGADLIYVATRRKSGALSEISPIWFAYVDGKIFFTTAPTSWKAKRIATGSPLYIWVGAEDGPFLEGAAAPVTDAAFIDRMGEVYAEKYWIAWLGLFKPRSDRVAAGKTVAYLVTPTRTEGAPPPGA